MAEESTAAAASVPPPAVVAAEQEPAAASAAPDAAAAAPEEPKLQGQEQEQEATAAEPTPSVVACQVPPRRFTPDGKVTSVDLTPDGAYVIVGCSDGTIRLYAMAEPGWGCEGAILGQIHAKGLITNLIFHVEVTDDGRFAFAGVLRGSVEMFAYDLTRLPPGQWAEDGTPIPPPRRLSRAQAEGLIECHTNLDPKLRGFGAVARVDRGEDAAFPEYRLICGLGIKNLHIWRFQEGAGPDGAGEPLWECIYDLVSSGMSIELLAIRPGGLEAVSKACGQNLRVWDLANATDATKCPYVDVLNTQDTRAVFGSFAFGGEGQLSLVRLDLCRQLNRMELPLPSTNAITAGGGAGRSKRRALCSVKDVVGTHGGGSGAKNGPVLVICSDGGVHCYEDGGAASATGKLVPVHSLTVEEEDDVAFTLAAVGKGRTPVVVQTRWTSQENRGEILVEPLRLGEGKEAALRRKALAELESGSGGGGGKPSASSGRHSTGGGVKPAAVTKDKENVPVAAGANDDEAASASGAAAPEKKKKRRAKSSPPLLVVPPLVLEEAGSGGPGSKSLSAPPTASPREGGGKPTPRSASKAAAAKAAAAAAAAAAEALPEGLVACRAQPVSRRGAGQGAGVGMLSRGQEQAPYNPGKRKHFDPFAAAFSAKSSFHAGLNGSTGLPSSKRGKPLSYLALSMAAGGVGSGGGMPRAMRDVEARRVVEDGAGKTAEFFKERVARQEALRDMRVAMEVERSRLAGTTTATTEAPQEQGSVVRSWAEVRAKHQGEREALLRKFRAEHDWVRERFLEAVERERLTFHVNKHALPTQVRDPIGFLWWHNARLPLKKQWGRFRSFPQQTAEVLALQGLPDVGARRFSLTAVLANYKDLAARTVKRQQAEADALAALQGMDLPFAHVRPLKVEYPYSGDWAVHDPVGAAVAEGNRRRAQETEETVVEEEGEGDVDDVLVPAEAEAEAEAEAAAVVAPVVAVPPPAGGEEEKQPDSPALSVTEGQQQEEARRASFDPAMDVEEGKVSVSPVPVVEQQEEEEAGVVCEKEEEDGVGDEGMKKVMEGEAKASMDLEA